MELTVVTICAWRGRAYLPVAAKLESGGFVDIEPVYTADLNLEALEVAVGKVLAAGHPRLPSPTREEWRKRKDPLLAATGTRSWKELAQVGVSYVIGWTAKEIRIDMSRLDKRRRWEYDPSKVRILPPATPLRDVVAIILEDIRSCSDSC
jgi:hypothetical protein